MPAGFYPTNNGQSWKVDNNTLTLKCENSIVGIFHFDLASYIGKQGTYQTAEVRPETYRPTKPDEVFMIGDPNMWPNAYITFRVTVKKKSESKTPSSSRALKSGQISPALSGNRPLSTKNSSKVRESAE